MILWNEDCLKAMQKIPDNTVDLIVTSPPYDNLRTYNGYAGAWSFEKFKLIAKEIYRVTADGGVAVWIVGDSTVNGSESGTSFKQALYFMDCGYNLHDTMIWNKGCFTATGALKTRYAQVFEYMFVFSKGKVKCFNPIKDRKCKRKGKYHGTIRQKDGTFRTLSNIGKPYNEYGIRYNVWEQPPCQSKKERTGHPAQFPEKLIEDHISSWTNQGDIVLDCFMGSGTTGVVCKRLNRRFIGIEICPEYFDIAKQRIAEAQK